MTKLRDCPICHWEARIVPESDFHQSFCVYDPEDGTVEHNFLHYGAIQCTNCGLTLPFHGGEENRQDNIDFWNGKEFPLETSPGSRIHRDETGDDAGAKRAGATDARKV